MQLLLQTPRRDRTYARVVRAVCLSTILLSGRGAHADGAAAPRPYNAFDLAAPRPIAVLDMGTSAALTGGIVLQNNNVVACVVGLNAVDKQLQIAPNKTTCPLYTQRVPAKLAVVPTTVVPAPTCVTPAELAQPQCTKLASVEFDNGVAASGTYESSSLKVAAHAVDDGLPSPTKHTCVAFYKDTSWEQQHVTFQVSGSSATSVPLQLAAASGVLFLKLGACSAPPGPGRIVKVTYKAGQVTATSDFPSPRPLDVYPNAGTAWELYVDQANEQSHPRITSNPNNYISTNSFGRVRVRHWKGVIPEVTTSGAGSALTRPSLKDEPSPTDPSALGRSFVRADGDAVISDILIPPRAPGTLRLNIRFIDPTVSDPAQRTKSEIGTDILVDRGYSSALRFGLAYTHFVKDATYSAIQRVPDGPFEIAKSSGHPTELVLGYALYLDGFTPGGRRYFLTDTGARAWLLRHLGIYAGFGAVSYTKGNLDYLRSFHLGLDIEVSQNFSIAVTGVLRRTTELAEGFTVGGAVPTEEIPTRGGVSGGLGIVLNFSTDFLKFTTGDFK